MERNNYLYFTNELESYTWNRGEVSFTSQHPCHSIDLDHTVSCVVYLSNVASAMRHLISIYSSMGPVKVIVRATLTF